MKRYVVARTASQRPSLMHVVRADDYETTTCGLDIAGWSRAYVSVPVPQILCKKCETHRRW